MDGELPHGAELSVSIVTGEAVVLGAFGRASRRGEEEVVRRVSGGPVVTVGNGSIHVLLALSRPTSLTPCHAGVLVNRHVRPLLRGLTRAGATAHYFGRDWVSVRHRPAAAVFFAHDTTTERSVFEAFVAVRSPFAKGAARASFLGKEPGTLEEILGIPFDLGQVRVAIEEAYLTAYDLEPREASAVSRQAMDDPCSSRPWAATAMEAIGEVAAGEDDLGKMRVGGDLLASRDAVARLEMRLQSLSDDASQEDVQALVQESLAAPEVALHGVRDLGSIVDVIVRARAQKRA